MHSKAIFADNRSYLRDLLADASQGILKVPEQVDDRIHASAIAEIISDDNLS